MNEVLVQTQNEYLYLVILIFFKVIHYHLIHLFRGIARDFIENYLYYMNELLA